MKLSPETRRATALSIPEGKKTTFDPQTCIKRMVREGERDCQFWSQLTVELDSPPVWRFETWFAYDRSESDLTLSSWSESMVDLAVGEMRSVLPWSLDRKLWREMNRRGIIWKIPLSNEEIAQAVLGEEQS